MPKRSARVMNLSRPSPGGADQRGIEEGEVVGGDDEWWLRERGLFLDPKPPHQASGDPDRGGADPPRHPVSERESSGGRLVVLCLKMNC